MTYCPSLGDYTCSPCPSSSIEEVVAMMIVDKNDKQKIDILL